MNETERNMFVYEMLTDIYKIFYNKNKNGLAPQKWG